MNRRIFRGCALGLLLLAGAGCATGRAVGKAQAAVDRGDLDSAVAFYRQALGSAPNRVDLRIALERYTRMAAEAHVKRARDLEAQNQLNGALAEYRLAADLDTTSTPAAAKAAEIERKIRDQIDAARPPARIDTLRQQAAQTSPIPHLDPRTRVPRMQFSNSAVRDILNSVAQLTGLNIAYDQGLDATLSRPYTFDVQDTPLEDVLNQVLTANGLTYKVVNQRSIFIYADNTSNRSKYEDQYTQTFYISNADPQELVQILNQVLQQGPAVRPVISVNKSQNSIIVRATEPVLKVIESLIAANDKPKPDVVIEAEILEVDRSFMRQLGLDLSQYALGLTFSPELAPSSATPAANAFPTGPPPFSANTLRGGTSAADFYITSPTALVRILESNATTRVLAKPELRGRDGVAMSIQLGSNIPIPQTQFNAAAAGGVQNIPATQVTYQAVGVNLLFTPRVTYQDEVIIDSLTLEKSGLGNDISVGGQTFPTIIDRAAKGSVRLRDGESTLLGGLLSEEDQTTIKALPGLTSLPVLRSIFGNSNIDNESTDIVMLMTPHIIRSHDLTAADLQPMYVGTNQNFGAGGPAPLISPDALGVTGAAAPASAGPAASGDTAPVPAPATAPGAVPSPVARPSDAPPPSAPPQSSAVPIQAVPIIPIGGPGQPAGARVLLAPPASRADGTLAAGGGPHTIPITITGATDIASISLSITYDPNVVKSPTVTAGSFMMQGGVTPTFVPHVDATLGRIDVAISRPAGQPGASAQGLLGAVAFTAGSAGATDVAITGVATNSAGQTVPLTFAPIQIVVK